MLIGIDGNEANQKNRVGVGQFAYNVIESLSRIDKENSYIIYLKEPPLVDFPKEKENWHYSIFGPSKLWTQVALPLKLFTQNKKLDIFYSPSHYAPRFSPFPIVISLMDLWHHRFPEQFARRDFYQLKNWERYSVRMAKRIVTISKFSKSEIMKFYQYPGERIMVAYPGFDHFKIENKESRIKQVREKYAIGGNYLLYLGTLQPKKNIVRLIEAFSDTSLKFPDICLVIAGKKGWLYEEVFNRVKELRLTDKVIFPGFVSEEEKPYLISGAKVFVFPSLYEGFGIPVLEAMSLGVPVVSSNEGSLPETGGQAAIYCNPYEKDIARAIEKVLCLNKEEQNEIIKKGFSQASKFSWEKCALSVLKALNDAKR